MEQQYPITLDALRQIMILLTGIQRAAVPYDEDPLVMANRVIRENREAAIAIKMLLPKVRP